MSLCRGGHWPSGGKPLRVRIGYGEYATLPRTDERHPRVASLALWAIHLLLAPTNRYKKASTVVEALKGLCN